jgi:hypothetical protein
MELLRFADKRGNASLRRLDREATQWHQLAKDLRLISNSKSLPELDPDQTPIIDDWYLNSCLMPMIVGRITYPGRMTFDEAYNACVKYTSPIHLFSDLGQAARSSTRWYRLGRRSILADDTIKGVTQDFYD